MKQVHAFYKGWVQGVGFRFTAERIAHELKLTGWVKNLADGRVELLAEGEEDLLKTFLERIRTGTLMSHIQREEVQWTDATGKFKTFGIRF